MEEVLRCDHSNESTFAVLSNGAVCFSAFLRREILTLACPGSESVEQEN